MKRLTSTLLVLVLVFLPIMSGLAVTARASYYFSSYGVSFLPGTGGKITIRFTVYGVEKSAQLGVSTYQIQRWSGSSWVNVTEWLTGSVGNDTVSHLFSKGFNGAAGETYRVHCFFVCQNSHGYGTQEFYSGSVLAKE